ncbi:MAG TPA: hypothetical protein P5132_00740 [Bacteroidales bacterium]|nr:hypothetical protein [Bacteroidales bacterium]
MKKNVLKTFAVIALFGLFFLTNIVIKGNKTVKAKKKPDPVACMFSGSCTIDGVTYAY